MFAIKTVINDPENFHLVDVGLRGKSKNELINGQTFF
jgi:hypothetical protein